MSNRLPVNVTRIEALLSRIVDHARDGDRTFSFWLAPERGIGEQEWTLRELAGALAAIAVPSPTDDDVARPAGEP